MLYFLAKLPLKVSKNTDSYRLALVKEIKACLKMGCRVNGPFSYVQDLESDCKKKRNCKKEPIITYCQFLLELF